MTAGAPSGICPGDANRWCLAALVRKLRATPPPSTAEPVAAVQFHNSGSSAKVVRLQQGLSPLFDGSALPNGAHASTDAGGRSMCVRTEPRAETM